MVAALSWVAVPAGAGRQHLRTPLRQAGERALSVPSDFNSDGFPDLAIGVPFEDAGTIKDAGAVSVLYGGPAGLQADAPDDQLWTQDSPGVMGTAGTSDRYGSALAAADFNGDGFADLAIGAKEVSEPISDAGSVGVLYGSPGGLQADAPDDQSWTQDSPNVEDSAEPGDWFGRSLAAGDFNADGLPDLAIGVRREDIGSATDAGAVNVLYGSPGGLQALSPEDQFWSQDSPSVLDQAESGDEFGVFLGTGDLNDDGFDDLAVGAYFEDLGPAIDAGGMNVLYGGPSGLQADAPDDQFWTQDSPGVKDKVETGDAFGHPTSGDFNGDGFGDLAIAASSEGVGSAADTGAVNVLYGSFTGLQAVAPDDQFWTQDSIGVQDVSEPGDAFGYSLARGDFDGDGYDDLAIGVKAEDVGTVGSAGAVNVLYGSSGGLQADVPDDQFWTQDSPGVQDQAEPSDLFGWRLSAADFDADGHWDLAVGARLEDVGSIRNAGAVSILYGESAGLQADSPDDQFWTQDSPGVKDQVEAGDNFGWRFS